jgi:DNA adenine methylase
MSSYHPLLKWPGGKSTEFEYIKHLIPAHKRYVEPFFGGGAVYFKLAPKSAAINDIASELVDLYKFVKGDLPTDNLKKELELYAHAWDTIDEYILPFEEDVTGVYKDFYNEKIDKLELKKRIETIVKKDAHIFNGLFTEKFSVDSNNLMAQIVKNLSQKLIRTAKVESQTEGGFSREDLFKNIETGFKSGFYMHFRDLLNKSESYKLTREKHIANWFYVREYCYASMFRFNSKGEFNIPYGGIGYNKKSLRGKINYMFSDDIHNLFANTEIHKQDFQEFTQTLSLSSDDFIFLDPPYDTEFSSYEGNVFDLGDQKRLADFIAATPAKCLMIIKETPFIRDLYSDTSRFVVESFEKNYLYNVRGRNDRKVNHLIIRNYTEV